MQVTRFDISSFRQKSTAEKSAVNQRTTDYCLKLKHKISQPIYIFNRENSQNSESPNGPRRGLDFIALVTSKVCFLHYYLVVISNILTVHQEKITKYILHVPFRVGQEQRTQRIFYFFSPSSPFLPPDVIQTVRRLKLRILGFLSRVFIAALLLLARRSILIIGFKTIMMLHYKFYQQSIFPKCFILGCRNMKMQMRTLKLFCLVVLLLSAPLEMFLAKKSLEESFFFGSHVTQNVIQDVLKLIVHTVNFFWESFLTFIGL